MTRHSAQILFFTVLVMVATVTLAQDRRIVPLSGSGRRYALIIGNNAYPWKPLKNAVNDAKDLAAELPSIGFAPENITLVTDANLLAMQKAGIDFLQKLRSDDLAFVFYSGHGVEVHGENYLVPTDFPADATELDVQYRAFSAQQFLRNLEASPARARIMILDACRDNPLRAARSASGGLARMDGSGTLIVFATGSGRTADDNSSGRNGLFTSRLLRALPTPGISVDDLMRQVAREVNHDSAGKQTPALYGLLLEDFALVPGGGSMRTANEPPAPRTTDVALEAWELVKNSSNPADFDEFAKQFPASDRVPLAKLRAAQLRRNSQSSLPTGESTAASLSGAPTLARESSASLRPGLVRMNSKDGLPYVWIPPGSFPMGCSAGEADCANDVRPTHTVTITKGFWLGQTPVTQAAYVKIIGMNPSHFRGDSLPVDSLTWNEAKQYCETAGGRMPTDAEWEYAARAGDPSTIYGNIDAIAWYKGNSGGQTHPVATKAHNAWNLYDMLGNVWEWTADWYGPTYYSQQESVDPQGPRSADKRMLRGGCWANDPDRVRASLRNRNAPAIRESMAGVRCVLE
jgi:formylglycine-generating enzyme required for sulfatase activity